MQGFGWLENPGNQAANYPLKRSMQLLRQESEERFNALEKPDTPLLIAITKPHAPTIILPLVKSHPTSLDLRHK